MILSVICWLYIHYYNSEQELLVVVFITLFHNVLNCKKSILVHFRPVFVFAESSHVLFNIMLNINVMTSETVNKRKISLYIATKLITSNKNKEL